MTNNSSNSKRIAKNTLFLYLRMLFSMAVSFYTSRVVLEILGVDDYGVYNVVGGIVALFSVLSGSLTTAISRFITFELGTNNLAKLNKVFSLSVITQVILALIILVIAETIGLWFLNYKLNIPTESIYAANWVYQLSLITFFINLISVPYNADIIAHERMNAYAYISILEVSLKLLIVFLLIYTPGDKLIIYAIFMTTVALIIRVIYGIYCKRNFKEATFHFVWEKSIFKEMFSFAGWNFLGNSAYMLNTQGVNMLINIFFGVAMNAARGIAVQADTALMGLVNNFTLAINPQITKSYASGDISYMIKLMNKGTKFCAYIMFMFMIPIIIETPTLLGIWLQDVPEHSVVFMRLVLVSSFCGAVGNCYYYGIMATGKIKVYQIYVTIVGALVFPFTWIAYKLGAPAQSTYTIYAIIYFSLNFIRIYFLKKYISYNPWTFFKDVLFPATIVCIVALIPPLLIEQISEPSLMRIITTTSVSLIFSCISIYCIGLTHSEKAVVKNKLTQIINKMAK